MFTRKDKVKPKENQRRHGSRRSGPQRRNRDDNDERTPRTSYVHTDDYNDDGGNDNSDSGSYEDQDTIEQAATAVSDMQINASGPGATSSYTTERLQYGQQLNTPIPSSTYPLRNPYLSDTYSSPMTQGTEASISAYNTNETYSLSGASFQPGASTLTRSARFDPSATSPSHIVPPQSINTAIGSYRAYGGSFPGTESGTQSYVPATSPMMQQARSTNSFDNDNTAYSSETRLSNPTESDSTYLSRDSMPGRQGSYNEFGSGRVSENQPSSHTQPSNYSVVPRASTRGGSYSVSPSYMQHGLQTARYGLSSDSTQHPMAQPLAIASYGQHRNYNSSTAPSQSPRSYDEVPTDRSPSLGPIYLPDPTRSCKCESGSGGKNPLCGVIVWPKPKEPKGGKITSKPREGKTKDKKSSRQKDATSMSDRVNAKGSGGHSCGPLMMPGITPWPQPHREDFKSEKDYEKKKKKWKDGYKEWKDISCPCRLGYFDKNGVWISGGEVRAGLKPPNPRWKDNGGRAPDVSQNEKKRLSSKEVREKLFERGREEVEEEKPEEEEDEEEEEGGEEEEGEDDEDDDENPYEGE